MIVETIQIAGYVIAWSAIMIAWSLLWWSRPWRRQRVCRVILLCIVALSACSGCVDAWPRDAKIKTIANGDPTIEYDWNVVVVQATQEWQLALGPDCLFPFEFADDGCPVRLVQPKDWQWGDLDGVEDDCYIEIKGPETIGQHAMLIHEFGHAFGLGHSTNPKSIMYHHASNREILPIDIKHAREELGCQ